MPSLPAFLAALLILAALPIQAALPPDGMSGDAVTHLFRTYGDTSGRWSGADSTVSVPLPDGRMAWLFSDTFIGPVNADGSRPRSTVMINNSIVIQDGTALVSTLHGGTAAAPQALVKPAAADELYWVADGTVEGNLLRVIYNRYRRTGTGSLDIALAGTALVTFTLPNLAVQSVTELPLGDTVAWGAALLEEGGYTYVYGSEAVQADNLRFVHLARVPTGGLSGAWQFWTGTSWSPSPAASVRLPLSGVGTAFSVQRVGGEYVLVTVEGNLLFNSAIVAYTASSPTGPFADPIDLYTAPEPAPGKATIVYDARIHPELARGGKLLFSYNVNSLLEDEVYGDASIYRPRFVEVDWPRAQPNPSTVPAAPTGLTATPIADGGGTVRLSWQPPAGDGLNYSLFQRDVTAGQTHFVRLPQGLASPSAETGLLKTGHTYEFRVTARSAAGEGPASGVVSATVVIAPPPSPANLRATPSGTGPVTLNWSPVPYAWRYEVFSRDLTAGATEFSPVADAQPADTTTTIDWLEHQHEYEFVVTATHGGGESPRSAPVRTQVEYPLPGSPTGLSATAGGDGTIRVSWAAPGPDVWFWVYQRDVTAGETGFTQLPLPITACCELNAGYLQHGHEYEYKVTAYNGVGESAPSNLARASARFPAPAAPIHLRATAGNGEVALTWTASATEDVWYLVSQRDITAGETAFSQLPLPVTTCCALTPSYLTNGHEYEFMLTATNQGGESAGSNLVRATPRAPLPGKPTALSATARGDGRIALSWKAPQEDLYYWVFQRDVTAGQAWQKLQYPVTTGTTFTAALLAHRHVYEFKVAGINQTGEGPASEVVRATAQYTLPAAPRNLRGTAAGDGNIDLDWDGPAQVYYWVYWRDVTAGQTAFTRAGFPTDRSSHSLSLLKHGHTYQFKVTEENLAGEGPASAVVNVVSSGGLPAAPSGLKAAAGDGKVTLRWTASPTPRVWYQVHQRDVTAGQSWQKLPLPVTTCCTMSPGLLVNGHTYEFKVSALTASGASKATPEASARPLPPLPRPPSALNATPGDGRVTLRWTASPTPPVLYIIEFRANGSAWQRAKYPLSSCCSFTMSLLSNGTTYDFRMRAANLAGESAPSNVDQARPMPPLPQPPSLLTATPGDGKATLKWSASPTPNVWYWIEMRARGEDWKRLKYPVSACCAFTVSLLFNTTTYDFRLRATNLAGNSGPSNVDSARPMPPMPKAPTGVTTRNGTGEVTVSWTRNATPTTHHRVDYRNVSAGEKGWRKSGPTTHTSHRLGSFNDGDAYEFRVVAFNVTGEAVSANWPRDVPLKRQASEARRRNINRINGSNTLAIAWALGHRMHCEPDEQQTICFGKPPSLAGQPVTVGDYLFFNGSSFRNKSYEASRAGLNAIQKDEALRRAEIRDRAGPGVMNAQGPNLLRHEATHSDQWALHPEFQLFVSAYGGQAAASQAATGNPGCRNIFELHANLYWGWYRSYGDAQGPCD
jgi:hypothetical protein